ncbi:MAG TPA: O-antigen ligase family protein [Terriglobales bacterium]|nr:O-antigen ligase family protein [Terriglobales bacterium]
MQTATLQAVPEVAARRWQAEKVAQIAFFATALFAAQLYLSPAQWFPVLEPTHHAAILSVVALGALLVRRMITNRPLWMGWRSALLAVYVGAAVLSPAWSIAPHASVVGAVEVAKHFLFFLAVVNTIDTPRRVRVALALYALAAIVPGWGTFNNWIHDQLLVEGFRGRWLGVMADPNHDAMALVGAIPILLFLTTARGHGWVLRIAGAMGAAACIAGIIATHSRGGSIGLAVAVLAFALFSRRKAIASLAVLVAAAGMMLFAPASFWERNETATLGAEDLSIEGRLQAWQVAGRAFSEHPLLGVGEGSFLEAWSQYAPLDSDRLFGHRYVAHNLILEVLGELGLVGFLGLAGFISVCIWSAWKARNGELGGEARAVLAALLGYLVCQMFAGYSTSWFLYALCGFCTCCEAWGKRAPAQVTV